MISIPITNLAVAALRDPDPVYVAPMGTPDAGLTRLFHLEPDLLRCPHAMFKQLRTEQPVARPEIECWVVLSRFDDIVHVARRPDVFSSMRPTGPVLAASSARPFRSWPPRTPSWPRC
jgi:cytochrome P450